MPSTHRALTITFTLPPEIVCIPRPLECSETEDGGRVTYRVTHRAPRWSAGQRPQLDQRDPDLAL